MTISEIKNEYNQIIGMSIMHYEGMKSELFRFIKEHETDTRSGVVKIMDTAKKKIEDIDAETARVRGMMQFEHKYADAEYICGIDEVGRGPLAGPVLTAAVVLPKDLVIPLLNDSKQVSKKNREMLYDIILSNAVSVSVGMNSEKVIDEKGIEFANKDAMKKAIAGLSVKPDLVLVDAVHIPDLDIKQVSIIKGDTLSVNIAAASIIAKVTRDRIMEEMDAKYPEYGFKDNAGYGSAKHIAALKTIGPCEIHRRSYIKGILGLE